MRQLAHGDDVGYFGPGSAPWAVHGALPTLVGGIRALLMQALHPAALAGIQQHSRYERDGLGRLAGTTQWLTVVTFGDRDAADRKCARVRGMHRRVTGRSSADGVQAPYSATDPDLLRWVHVAFTDSFLAAHRAWGGPIPGGADAYVGEWAKAGELVGVENPPRSVAKLQAQISDYGPLLRGNEPARRTVDFIRHVPMPTVGIPACRRLFAGAVSMMPAQHRELLGLPPYPSTLTRPAVAVILGGLQLALARHRPPNGPPGSDSPRWP